MHVLSGCPTNGRRESVWVTTEEPFDLSEITIVRAIVSHVNIVQKNDTENTQRLTGSV